ncbi:MAG: hypothetical protein U5K74_06220 [Gemmatimonadaceae bacterium]|nr:hypothetical protein [Gemmatimonadaceae bacterium]
MTSRAISNGIITFSSAENSRKRWWNWKTKPIDRFRTSASAASLPACDSNGRAIQHDVP